MISAGRKMILRVAVVLLCASATPLAAQVWEPGDPLPPGTEAPQMTPQATPQPAPQINRAPSPQITPAPEVPDVELDDRVMDIPAAPPTRAPAPAPAVAVKDDPEDFLCGRAPAGKAEMVPAPFDQWAVLVCTQAGQALVPVMGEAWVAHGTTEPVSILALPPGATAPTPTPSFDARYDIGFEMLVGVKTLDERRRFADRLMTSAINQTVGALPDYEAVWQLDAQSRIEDTRYNLFFYVKDEKPEHIIACLQHCAQALHLDVLRGDAAAQALAR
jgi:hypothetical protein